MDDPDLNRLPQPEPPRRHGRPRLVAAVLATALVAGGGGVAVGYAAWHGSFSGTSSDAPSATDQHNTSSFGNGSPAGGDTDQAQLPQEESSDTTTPATGSQLTGLVRIATTQKYNGAEAAGTGMVLTSDGEVLTNHHVVAGATSIQAMVMSTGRTYAATVVGTDAKDDVAVLRLTDATGLSTVTTNADDVSVGDAVTAVGDANGTEDELSAATGTVLAEDQSITTQSDQSSAGERLTGLLEISSDAVPGDSGGATYDADGKVIGMTSAASSGGQDIVGYSIPISTALRIVGDLENHVTSSRYSYGTSAFLGVGLDTTGTAVLGVYRGTPAARAGLEEGDTITAIGSTRVTTSAVLRRAVAALSPGDDVSLSWTDASGASHSQTVTLTTGPVQ